VSFTALTESMVMVMIAEMGDRSQIACMVLGSRTRPWPVLLGAIAAFIVLDGLAMLLGGGLGALLPPRLLAGLAAALFLGFGVQAWRSRDAADRRVIEGVKDRTNRRIDSQRQVGGWPELAAGRAPDDTDRDGMPDAWETAQELDPRNPEDRNGAQADGYTNLEHYLSERAGDTER
jgi:hypothetical protein